MVLTLNLAGAPADVTASVRTAVSGLVFARASGKWTGTVSITNTAGTALTGPLQIALKNLPAGVALSNASGSQGGAPYITAAVASLAPGATITVPVSFTKTGTAAITYTTTVYSGNF